MHVVVFTKSIFHVGNPLYPPIVLTFHLVLISCTLSVGPQLVPKTLNIKSNYVSFTSAVETTEEEEQDKAALCGRPLRSELVFRA